MLFVFFDNKEEIFKKHSFLNKVKQICTDLMNQLVKDEVEKLSVFDLEGPCLADLNEWAKGYRNDDEAVHMYITMKMYPCSGGTDTVSPGL